LVTLAATITVSGIVPVLGVMASSSQSRVLAVSESDSVLRRETLIGPGDAGVLAKGDDKSEV
jgi:hypothetical protein